MLQTPQSLGLFGFEILKPIAAFIGVLLTPFPSHNWYQAVKKYNKVVLKKKKLGLQRNEYENVMREISILQRLKHPNIVNLFEVINDEEDDYIYLVMENLSGGSVLSKQQASVCLEEPIARTYFVDIASGLEYRTSPL